MDKNNLRDDLTILKDMYPEMEVNEFPEESPLTSTISGCVPVRINLATDVTINFQDKKSINLSRLTSDLISFKINPLKYPQLEAGIQLNIESQWMTEDDKSLLLKSIVDEFNEITNPNNEELFDEFFPTLMLVLSFISEDSSTILFPQNRRVCKDEEEFKIFDNIRISLEDYDMKHSNYNCSICMDTKKGDKMVKIPCQNESHYLCRPCSESYFTNMINNGDVLNIRCPDCKFEEINLDNFRNYKDMIKQLFTPLIDVKFLRTILNEDLCKKFEELYHSQAATKLSKHCFNSCVICKRCERWCVKEDLDDSMIHCNYCDFTFCFDCLHSWHGYHNKCGKKFTIPREVVEEYTDLKDDLDNIEKKLELEVKYGKKILEIEVNEYLADKLLDLAIEEEGSNLQRCPTCRLVVQRSEGCNKMKCSMCDSMFCFICGYLLYKDDPYAHFREPRSECYGRLFEGMEGVDD
ncbi:hypothetical protein TBLA_0B06360 [Henningerozyma blattae CBS 6284]|uniref:RBR-type E3 ubiquitin transferase n=1 Tax=Henningerozyma blattae (strain ATCC 34711 / CBS 6284 / DSM 70876 / NBRC 10599 / NRRL Y-10934 / UCD 77-7) TaxID=1071380 RepID=I2GZA8_HENB6|nr:hypothetical protein TBLA_0B06360 [Tetrapisispora blattae CBS 6284]CCH59460.1 hypothetical protein TBLA_0B06360 [Tetrapisispora blattae CBS 6284]